MIQITAEEHQDIYSLLQDLEEYGVNVESHELQKDPGLTVHIEGIVPEDEAAGFSNMTNEVREIAGRYGVPDNIHFDNEPRPNANMVLDTYIAIPDPTTMDKENQQDSR